MPLTRLFLRFGGARSSGIAAGGPLRNYIPFTDDVVSKVFLVPGEFVPAGKLRMNHNNNNNDDGDDDDDDDDDA